MVLVRSTTQMLGIFVFYHTVWLDGLTYAKPQYDEEGIEKADLTMATLLEMEKLQAEEDILLHKIKKTGKSFNTDEGTGKTINCGGSFDTTPGTITHPEDAKNYGNHERCVWTISSSVSLYFYFSKFNTEVLYDFVTARDGGTIGSPKLGTYSGKSLEHSFVTKGDAHIQFDSDDSVIGRGFMLHWRIYSAEEQCRDMNGVCLTTGDTCPHIITIIENSCEDTCACCHPPE